MYKRQGLYRDPGTLAPVEYYCKMPHDIAERDVIVLDPMLATGGSAVAAIQFLKNYECRSIKLMNILAAPEGIQAVRTAHPDVDIYVAAVDEKLNDHGYIVPGLGDAGEDVYKRQPHQLCRSRNSQGFFPKSYTSLSFLSCPAVRRTHTFYNKDSIDVYKRQAL